MATSARSGAPDSLTPHARPPATNPGAANCKQDDYIDYQQRLTGLASQLAPDRLLLLNTQFRVVYDSGSQGTTGQAIAVAGGQGL